MDATYENYLRDLGCLIKEGAEEARATYVERTVNEEAFNLGYLMAYHRVVTLMQQQADAFGIPLEKLCLEGIPEEFFFVQEGSNPALKQDAPSARPLYLISSSEMS